MIPLSPTAIDIEVTGPVAEWTVRRAFDHDGPAPIDAELWFALPPDAALDALTVTVGARRIVSRIAPRAAAQEAYDRAAEAGQLATLLESQRSDAVVQRIANLLPGDRVEIEFHLVQPAPRPRRRRSCRATSRRTAPTSWRGPRSGACRRTRGR